MFKSAKRLLVAATVVIAASAPSVAYARFFEYGPPAGSAPNGQMRPAIAQLRTAAQQRRLDELQASVKTWFASEGGWPSTASAASATSSVHPSGPSSQARFHWGDAGIGAAGVLALVGIATGATVTIRRRVRETLTG
ncbi:MAG: hypothetical protein WCD11_11300 [Solirubrobacteraceae bacterium]